MFCHEVIAAQCSSCVLVPLPISESVCDLFPSGPRFPLAPFPISSARAKSHEGYSVAVPAWVNTSTSGRGSTADYLCLVFGNWRLFLLVRASPELVGAKPGSVLFVQVGNVALV